MRKKLGISRNHGMYKENDHKGKEEAPYMDKE